MPVTQTEGAGNFRPIHYEPGKITKRYWRVFLPDLYQFDHVFWIPIREGREVAFAGKYLQKPRLILGSNSETIFVEKRDEDELRALEQFLVAESGEYIKGPTPNSFGLTFRRLLNRQQTEELSKKVPSGEIHDLFLLSMHLRDIYDTPADSRDAKNKGLVEWLQKLPDIKRQCLIEEVRDVAEGHRLTSTAEAVGKLIDWK